MDSVFVVAEAERAAFLQRLMHTFGCSYTCLWSYLPHPSKCLLFLDGIYKEESNQLQPSSSSGSLSRMLFNSYRDSVHYVDLGRVPGFAFKNNIPYLEIKLAGIPRLASSETQMQFYKEAGIKTVIFMGCTIGELELGMATEPQVNLEMEIKNMLPIIDVSGQPASASSSLRSLSYTSVEHSHSPPNEAFLQEKQRSEALTQIRSAQFPTIESENDAMTKAILAVLTSSSPMTTSLLHDDHHQAAQPSAFRSYREVSGTLGARLISNTRKKNMFGRVVLFYRNLSVARRTQEFGRSVEGKWPTAAQMHHMVSERRRREKLNESFRVLRSLLPPGSKKDKASVLSNTTEVISSLRTQVEQLRQQNETLKALLSMTNENEEADIDHQDASSNLTHESVSVEVTRHVSPSTSQEATFFLLDLRVNLRSGECSSSDLVIRVLGFLKQQRNVTLLSVQSNTRIMVESIPVHGLVLRLKVEGDAFDELGFQEAVRRVVYDLPH